MTPTKREFFDRAVKELDLDTSDPFTLLLANALALVDERDALRTERDRLRAALLEIAFDAERLVSPHEIVAKARIAAESK